VIADVRGPFPPGGVYEISVVPAATYTWLKSGTCLLVIAVQQGQQRGQTVTSLLIPYNQALMHRRCARNTSNVSNGDLLQRCGHPDREVPN
jgi:hypothetical protein